MVCAYVMAYLGDMPQQNENAGFKKQRADRSCRSCLATTKDRENLHFDVVKNGRYHFQTMQLKKHAETLNKTRKAQFYKTWGLKEIPAILSTMTPALDLINVRNLARGPSEYLRLGRTEYPLLEFLSVFGSYAVGVVGEY